MPFTFRPSVGADVILGHSTLELASIDLYNEGGTAIALTRPLGSAQYQYLPSGSLDLFDGTAGSDTIFGSSDVGTRDVFLWHPSTATQVGVPAEMLTPFSNNAATSIDVVLMGAGDDILSLSNSTTVPGNPGTYTLAMTGFGGLGNDILWMAAGNDAVFGDEDNDLLGGQGGNDTLYGGIGLDTMYGGLGEDRAFGGGDGDRIYGDAGNDTLSGMANGDTLYGGADTDIVSGGAHSDTLYGDGGTDTLYGGTEQDTLYGGADGDALYGEASNDVVQGDAGTDTLYGGDLQDTLYGGTEGDGIYGDAGDDSLYGDDGNDTLYGGDDGDRLFGDANQDTLYGGTGDDSVYGGANADVLAGDLGIDRLFGGDVSDSLHFSADANIVAAGGDDGVRFWNSEDPGTPNLHVITGDANRSFDTFDGGAGIDTFIAGNGNDILVQNSSALVVDGVAQADGAGRIVDIEVFLMGGGADVLALNSPDNVTTYGIGVTAFGGALNDLIVAGDGDDRLSGGNPNGSAAADVFDTDTIYGGLGSDVIFGDRENQTVSTEGGNDTLYGGRGDDTIFGDAADDLLYGGTGADSLFGGTGNDRLVYESDGDFEGEFVVGWDGSPGGNILELVLEAGTSGTFDSFAGGTGFDIVDLRGISTPGNRVYFGAQAGVPIASFISGVEMIYAGAAADVINLSRWEFDIDEYDAYASNITIVAGADSDVVFSGSGSDRIYGDHLAGTLSDGDGSDTLFGGMGNDLIYGDSVDGQQDGASVGDDVLFGGGGNDVVYGGRGNDSLVDIDDSSLYGGDGSDLLVLSLSGVFATGVTHGGDESDNEGDGDDRVFVGGYYESVTAGLGGGNDLFISLATGDNGEGEGGAKTDRVSGGTGDDVVSTWFGDDTIDGGSGGDALWGGAGVDTIFGGPGTDYLYGGGGDEGEGDGDVLVGGDGSDYYYWARTDGIDRIDDQDVVVGGEGENYILVFSGYDENSEMPAGSGVFEADHDLYDNAGGDDMVQLMLDPAGDGSTEYILTILQGEGAGSQLHFDSDEVSVIGLWNHDATAGTPVITAYVWDPIDGRYEYQA